MSDYSERIDDLEAELLPGDFIPRFNGPTIQALLRLARELLTERDALQQRVGELEAAIERSGTGCRVIYGNRPRGTTCLDEKQHATDNPDKYGEDFRLRLMDGQELCSACVLKEVIKS